MSFFCLTGFDTHEGSMSKDQSVSRAPIPLKSNTTERNYKHPFSIFSDSSNDESTKPVAKKKKTRIVIKEGMDDEGLRSSTSTARPLSTINQSNRSVASFSPASKSSATTKSSIVAKPSTTNQPGVDKRVDEPSAVTLVVDKRQHAAK